MITKIARNLHRRALALKRDGSGAAAVAVALMTPVLLGGLALTVDISMYRLVHGRLQTSADAAALAGLQALAAKQDVVSTATAIAQNNVPDNYGNFISPADVVVGRYSTQTGFVPGIFPDSNAVRVRTFRTPARGNGVRQIFSGLFGVDEVDVSAQAVAARPFNVFYEPPELTILDNEAGDFNEMYVYCYQTLGEGSPESRRTNMTLVANNMPSNRNIVSESSNALVDANRAPAPTSVSQGRIAANPPTKEALVWPRCEQEGQTLSFRLKNVRHAKSNSVLWNNPGTTIGGIQPRRPVYDHYTDTKILGGKEDFTGLTGKTILETIRCDSLDECNPAKSGNKIGGQVRNRVAKGQYRVDSSGCEPGKFMYFGWEDRPGGTGTKDNWLHPGWTDFDFDDIAVVMRCPRNGQLGDGRARLVG